MSPSRQVERFVFMLAANSIFSMFKPKLMRITLSALLLTGSFAALAQSPTPVQQIEQKSKSLLPKVIEWRTSA